MFVCYVKVCDWFVHDALLPLSSTYGPVLLARPPGHIQTDRRPVFRYCNSVTAKTWTSAHRCYAEEARFLLLLLLLEFRRVLVRHGIVLILTLSVSADSVRCWLPGKVSRVCNRRQRKTVDKVYVHTECERDRQRDTEREREWVEKRKNHSEPRAAVSEVNNTQRAALFFFFSIRALSGLLDSGSWKLETLKYSRLWHRTQWIAVQCSVRIFSVIYCFFFCFFAGISAFVCFVPRTGVYT